MILDSRKVALVGVLVVVGGALWAVSRPSSPDRQPASVPSSASPRASAEPGPPPDETAFRFVVLGDFGTGEVVQRRVADRLCRWRDQRPFDLVVTTGDNVYPDGAAEHFEEKFFEPYECLFSNGVMFRATLGNHDVATDGGEPELSEPGFGLRGRNYVFTRAGVRFVMVDSNDLDLGWVEAATRPRAADRWTVVAFHHPVYSAGDGHGSTPGFAEALRPIFEENGVDLVLNGHDHVYSVTKEIRGIRYVVTGGGGARAYGCLDVPMVVECVARPHFLEVTASPTQLLVTAVPDSGRPFHRFVVERG